jgi:ribose 5-phosphate isomerase B
MHLAIASDHAGFAYKTLIIAELRRLGHSVRDFGTDSDTAVDYPLYIRPAAEALARGEYERAIVLGGSGNGENIVANRVRGVRCAYCFNVQTARLGRQHNDANCIAIGQRLMDADTALAIVRAFLETPFEGGRHVQRIALIDG